MRIAIASDHAAFALKQELADWMRQDGHDVIDLGPGTSDRVDYPEYGRKLADEVMTHAGTKGVALCGSGIGIAIAANRHPGIRCAQASEPVSAALARAHNDANIIAIGARLVGSDMAKACVTAFLDTAFEGGRHQHRVDMLTAIGYDIEDIG